MLNLSSFVKTYLEPKRGGLRSSGFTRLSLIRTCLRTPNARAACASSSYVNHHTLENPADDIGGFEFLGGDGTPFLSQKLHDQHRTSAVIC